MASRHVAGLVFRPHDDGLARFQGGFDLGACLGRVGRKSLRDIAGQDTEDVVAIDGVRLVNGLRRVPLPERLDERALHHDHPDFPLFAGRDPGVCGECLAVENNVNCLCVQAAGQPSLGVAKVEERDLVTVVALAFDPSRQIDAAVHHGCH